ncbi:MAG: class I SAM-dependent methyltransferase [Candidatus Thermoplasmatota archaeon]|nr:class I SAM-dependent methyltransferase [Candidatus Thermoplasmatota archaeon]
MKGTTEAWDSYYGRNPVDWKGSPAPLPDMPSGSRMLDVGCGTGSSMLQALEMGYEVVGIDISSRAVDRARKRLVSRGFDAEVLVMNVMDDISSLGPFDCILLHHVLDSLPEKERGSAIGNCRQVLANRGILSFQDLSTADMRYGSGERIERNTFRKKDGIFCHFFTEKEVRDLFFEMETLKLETIEWTQRTGTGRKRRSRIIGIFRDPRV